MVEQLAWPLNEHFKIYGKFGAIFWNSEISLQQQGGTSLSNSDSDLELTYGAGVAYGSPQGFSIGLEWNQYNKLGDSSFARVGENKIETVNVDTRTLSLVLSYQWQRLL